MFVHTAYLRAVYQGMVNVVAMVVAQGMNKVTVTIMSPAVAAAFVKDVAKAILKAIDIRAVQGYFSLSDRQARTLHIAAKFVRLLPESARWGSGLCLLGTDHLGSRLVVPRHGAAIFTDGSRRRPGASREARSDEPPVQSGKWLSLAAYSGRGSGGGCRLRLPSVRHPRVRMASMFNSWIELP